MFTRTKSRSQITSAFSRTNTPTPPPSTLATTISASAATSTTAELVPSSSSSLSSSLLPTLAVTNANNTASTSPQPTTPVNNSVYNNTRHAATAATTATVSTSTSASASSAAKNILKNVESHIRLMSHLENASVSSSYNAVRLRKLVDENDNASNSSSNANHESHHNNHHGDINVEAISQSSAMSQATQTTSKNSNNNNNNNSNNVHDNSQNVSVSNSTSNSRYIWTEPYSATRIHRGTSTSSFYETVIAPCVANSIAGQSYLFLVTGPIESGRSQTLYGSPHHHERGIIEMTAADLLTRMKDSDVSYKTNNDSERLAHDREKTNSELPTNKQTAAEQLQLSLPLPPPPPLKSSQPEEHLTSSSSSQPRSCILVHSQPNNITTAYSSAGKLTVTYGAFTTRGDHITDTITGKPVKLVQFPPPLCTVALPCMRLLEGDPALTVVVPERKYVDTSCIIQFQIYATVDSSGRRSLATLTFVDVAAFKLPLCKDVLHLIETVKRVSGTCTSPTLAATCLTANFTRANNNNNNNNNNNKNITNDIITNDSNSNNKGRKDDTSDLTEKRQVQEEELLNRVDDDDYDPHFKDYKLTTILESALIGYVTLVSISTISGRNDLHESACTTLEFASLITRIRQVLTLTHIQAPKWLFEAAQKLELLRVEREQMINTSYENGVYACYTTIIQWFNKYYNSVHNKLVKLIDDTAAVRNSIIDEMEKQLLVLQDAIASEVKTCEHAEAEAHRAHQNACEAFEQVKQLDEKIAVMEQQISQIDLQSGHQISEMRFEIATLEAQTVAREQELQLLEKNWKIYEHRKSEICNVVKKAAAELNNYHDRYKCARELELLSSKRIKLESNLRLASNAAQKQTDDLRVDRERREKVSRLMLLERRVESLKDATAQIRSSYVIDTNTSERV